MLTSHTPSTGSLRAYHFAAPIIAAIFLAPPTSASPEYIAGVPDWDQPQRTASPPGPDWDAWCVPTATANIIGFYEDIHAFPISDSKPFPFSPPTTDKRWQDYTVDNTSATGIHSATRADIGWFLNTNDKSNGAGGCAPTPCSGGHRGTQLGHILSGATGNHGLSGASGLLATHGAGHVKVINYGASSMNPSVFASFDNTGHSQATHGPGSGGAYIRNEMRQQRPALLHFEHFNIINRTTYTDSDDFFSNVDEYDTAEWGGFTFTDPDNLESWDPDEGIGHTVTVVGYFEYNDPDNPFPGGFTIIIHDNLDGYDTALGAPRPLALPWSTAPWSGTTFFQQWFGPCDSDVNADFTTDLFDIVSLFFDWGVPGPTPGDLNADNTCNVNDLFQLLACWPNQFLTHTFRLSAVEIYGEPNLFGQEIALDPPHNFYQAPFGNNYAPPTTIVSAFPETEWDSYVALGGRASTSSAPAWAPTGSTPMFSNSIGHFPPVIGVMAGGWYRPAGVESTPNPYDGYNGVFIARITTPAGATFQFDGEVRALIDLGDVARVVRLPVNGPPVLTDESGTPLRNPMTAKRHPAGNPTIPGFGAADVYDVYVQEAPAPVAASADVNASGIIDVNDITYVLFRLGNSGAPGYVDGDANADGITDVNDISYVIFRL
jgi:hypothetical protein